jgi:hypothetical protein
MLYHQHGRQINRGGHREAIMQMAITFMAVVAGMVFSLAVALLVEEIIFGQVFRLLFASQKLVREAVAAKSERNEDLNCEL